MLRIQRSGGIYTKIKVVSHATLTGNGSARTHNGLSVGLPSDKTWKVELDDSDSSLQEDKNVSDQAGDSVGRFEVRSCVFSVNRNFRVPRSRQFMTNRDGSAC